jgi:hypothetical protein
MKSGDKIKFGEKYCKKTGRLDLLNKTIMLSPQYFEEDNGLYVYEVECPGIYDSENEEADSIYHLFGNNLEGIHDCEIIPATKEDLLLIQKQKEEEQKALVEEHEQMVKYFAELEKQSSKGTVKTNA